MIIGMAGHIDHGKSALVTALTGKTMDRLAEERRRGITIDLNFAPMDLGDGITAGVVDVPGHEDFVRTMVAGASGADLALLVVAADEGVMPQTLEHLAVVEHLAVPRGIPVVTKADLADPEWLDLVSLDLEERLASSTVPFGRAVAVSAITLSGIPELRRRIAECAAGLPPRIPGDLFRLPVDRAFSLAGVGTVVTGTAWSGRVHVGDEVALLPGGPRGRVRSIESHGRPVEASEPGARVAVGIAGIARDGVGRGSVLVAVSDPWEETRAWDVELALDPRAPRPLAQRSRVRVLLGTAEIMARVHPRSAIVPGGRGLARLALEQVAIARGGDRFVLRSYSPVTTIGGGVVLDPAPPPRAGRWPVGMAGPGVAERLLALVERRRSGVSSAMMSVLTGLAPGAASALARSAPGLRLVGERWVGARLPGELGARALDLLRLYHRDHPADRGMSLQTLRQSLRAPQPIVEAALEDLVRAAKIRRVHEVVALAGFAPRPAADDATLRDVVRLVTDGGLTPPSVAELEQRTGRQDVAAVLRLAAAHGAVEAVERDRFYSRAALERFARALQESPGDEIVPSELRDRLGISRKYLIPLLQWADMEGLTSRVGGVRLRRRRSPA